LNPDAPATSGNAPDDIHEAMRIAQGARTKPKLAVTIVAIIAVTIIILGWFAGWFAPTAPVITPQTCAGEVDVTGAGDPAVGPAMQGWSAVYNTSVCAKVTYATSGSGLTALAAKSVDFAVIESPLSSAQASQLGGGALVLPVALEATAVVYHVQGLASGLRLSGAVLAAIYLGNITNWDSPRIEALNPGFHFPTSLPITPIYCSVSCATTLVFTGYLARSNVTWNSTVGNSSSPAWPIGTAASGSLGVAQAVNATPGGIGYVELPIAQKEGLSWANMENPRGNFTAPSPENTTAAAAAANPIIISETGVPSNQSLVDEAGNSTYPMATLSYAVVYQDIGVAYNGAVTRNTAQWVGAYILWITTAAQPRAAPAGYAPLPGALVVWDSEVIEKLQYYGLSVLSGGDADGGL
jgi:phosphate transport system substrate-binding protein